MKIELVLSCNKVIYNKNDAHGIATKCICSTASRRWQEIAAYNVNAWMSNEHFNICLEKFIDFQANYLDIFFKV